MKNRKELIYLNEQKQNYKTIQNPFAKQSIEFIITESYANRLSLKEIIINILYLKNIAGDKDDNVKLA